VNNPLKNKTYLKDDRNPAEYAILAVLSKGPAHGYDLFHFLEAELGAIWNLGISQIYGLLSRMEKQGLVLQNRLVQEKRPDRKVFSLTPLGLETFKAWLVQPVRHVRDLRLEFLFKLHFARIRGRGTDSRLIKAQITLLTETFRRLQEQIGSAETFIEQQALEYRRIQTQAAINWLQKIS